MDDQQTLMWLPVIYGIASIILVGIAIWVIANWSKITQRFEDAIIEDRRLNP